MEKLKNTRILAAIGVVACLLGTLLPYIKIDLFFISDEIKLWNYWEGKIILTLTLANALFIFKDYVEKYTPQLFKSELGKKIKDCNNQKMVLIPTILIVLFVIYLFIEYDIDLFDDGVKYSIGFFAEWIGIICLVGHSILYKKELIKSQENSIMNIQNNMSNINYSNNSNQLNEINNQQLQPNTPLEQNNVKFCTKCGNKCEATVEICFMCGNKF